MRKYPAFQWTVLPVSSYGSALREHGYEGTHNDTTTGFILYAVIVGQDSLWFSINKMVKRRRLAKAGSRKQ